MAESLHRLGVEEAMVVHGLDGMDEISTIGETRVSWLHYGEIETLTMNPRDFGVEKTSIDKLSGAGPEYGARVAYKVLVGEAEKPQMDVVLVNSVAGIKMAGLSDGFTDGMELARESVESGAAYMKLRDLVKHSGGDLSRLEAYEDE